MRVTLTSPRVTQHSTQREHPRNTPGVGQGHPCVIGTGSGLFSMQWTQKRLRPCWRWGMRLSDSLSRNRGVRMGRRMAVPPLEVKHDASVEPQGQVCNTLNLEAAVADGGLKASPRTVYSHSRLLCWLLCKASTPGGREPTPPPPTHPLRKLHPGEHT